MASPNHIWAGLNSVTELAKQADVDECFQSVSEGKSLIASAITGKGISTSSTATFQQMANNISSIRSSSLSIAQEGFYKAGYDNDIDLYVNTGDVVINSHTPLYYSGGSSASAYLYSDDSNYGYTITIRIGENYYSMAFSCHITFSTVSDVMSTAFYTYIEPNVGAYSNITNKQHSFNRNTGVLTMSANYVFTGTFSFSASSTVRSGNISCTLTLPSTFRSNKRCTTTSGSSTFTYR